MDDEMILYLFSATVVFRLYEIKEVYSGMKKNLYVFFDGHTAL